MTAAPVQTKTTVTSVRPDDGGYAVRTDQDSWDAQAVVLASGACNTAQVPALHEAMPTWITMLTPMSYRTPSQLSEGGVLVVGASASGIQIADEVHRSGRAAILAVGEHVRMPRSYRGLEILWLGRLLDTVDAWAAGSGFDGGAPRERFAPTEIPSSPPLSLDLRSGEIRTIIWATGFRPALSWLDVPVFNRKGQLIHDGGVTAWPGLYVIGMPFLRRRESSLIDGAAADALDVAVRLAGYLASPSRGDLIPRTAPSAEHERFFQHEYTHV